MEAEQYVCQLRYLHLADVMASAACGLLSASEQSSSTRGSYTGNRAPCCYHSDSNLSATDKALPCYRLVLVFGNARFSNWPRSGRRASACGSLYVSATDRPVHYDNVGRWRSVLGINTACPSRTSRSCRRDSHRGLGRARSCPSLILEKQ